MLLMFSGLRTGCSILRSFNLTGTNYWWCSEYRHIAHLIIKFNSSDCLWFKKTTSDLNSLRSIVSKDKWISLNCRQILLTYIIAVCSTFSLFSSSVEAASVSLLLSLSLNFSFQLEFTRLMTVQCDIVNSLFKEIIGEETDRQRKTVIESVWRGYYSEVVKEKISCSQRSDIFTTMLVTLRLLSIFYNSNLFESQTNF